MNNIEDAFSDKKLDVRLQRKMVNDTQKSEAAPMLNNEYKESKALETKNSLQKWEVSSKSSSSNKLDTARNLLTNNSRPGSAASHRSNKISPMVSESDLEELKEFKEKQSYLGDTQVLTDESKKTNGLVNTSIFMVLLGFIAFLTLFC